MKFSDMPYKRVGFDELEGKLKELINQLQEADNGDGQFEVHKQYYELFDSANTQIQLASIRHDVDVTDKFYEEEQDYYDEIMPKVDALCKKYETVLYESPYRARLEELIGRVAFKNMELSIKSMDDSIIALKQEENALTSRYTKIIASARVDWNGEELNLSLLKPYMTNQNRSVRKEAWQKYTEYFESVRSDLEGIYDKLVKNRTAQARAMGYENYLELGYCRMRRNSYGREEIETLRRTVKKEFVPLAEKVHEIRRRRLGLEKGDFSYIDDGVYYKEGNPKPTGTPKEILESGQRLYGELSPETKEFMDFMMENELFDVLGRKNKRAGGYMTYLPDYHSPFIFANFNGSSGDVDVITHECGHAFQGYVSAWDPIREHNDITMETAEIHSMSMEYFTGPYLKPFFGEDTDRYRNMHLEDSIAFVPYGCMVDEFQHIVYDHPDMTPRERNDAWAKLEQEYRPHHNLTGCSYLAQGTYWQCQHHIFTFPLYYIDYVMAQLCSFQYKIWMEQDYKEAFASYLKLCRLSAKDFYQGLLKASGLKVPYEDGCIGNTVEKLTGFLSE